MLRHRFARTFVLVAAFAGLAVAGSSAALAQDGGAITLGTGKIAVNKNYRYTIDLTCPAGPALCEGILSIDTANAIKPYRTYPKKKWIVGAFPYKVAAGATAKVPARILGGGAAQLALTGSVKIRVQIVRDGSVVGERVLTLTKKVRA